MRSTFSRTFSTAAIILLTALLAVGIAFQVMVKDYLINQNLDTLRNDGEVISELVLAYNGKGLTANRDFNVSLAVTTRISGADVVVCSKEGKLLFCADAPLGCEHVGMALSPEYLEQCYANNGCTSIGIVDGLYEENRYVVSVPVQDSLGAFHGVVLVSTPVDRMLTVITKISEIFVIISVLVVAVSIVVMTILARRQTAPLREMAKTANAFGHGELTARVNTSGKYAEEVEELAHAFNNMASSLQKSEYQRQEFVANVSHELKTPMTTISGYVDGILDGTIPPEQSEKYLQIVSDETKRLNRLVRSMLDISRLQDQGIPDSQKSHFDLTECVGQVLISFEKKILDKKLDVQVLLPEHPVVTFACKDHITQVVYNLVDNAVKFSPEGGVLSLDIRESDTKAFVSIQNQGQTIPAEELPLVFDRFHKMDKSRSQNRDSWGLGLYIVKTIICSHGEDISVTSRDGKTTFTFTLPLGN